MHAIAALALLLQDPPSETLVTAPRALPVATDSPARTIVIEGEELARTGETSLTQAIARAAGPGLWLQETNLGGGSPILRGFVGEKVLIVIDGVRVNDATTRLGPNQSLNTIDPAIVERVEIVRGPASVAYGSDAVGGAILIWTKRRMPGTPDLQGNPLGFDATLSGGYESASDARIGSLALSGAGLKDAWYAVGSSRDFEDQRSGGGEVDFTGYESRGLFGSYVHSFDADRSLRLTARVNRDFDVPRTDRLLTGYGQTQPSNSRYHFTLQENAGATLAYTDEDETSWFDRMQTRLFLRHYVEEREIQGTGSATLRDERDRILGYGLGVDWQKAIGDDHLLTYGVDLEQDEVPTSERTNVNTGTGVGTAGVPTFAPDSRFLSTGVFAQDEIAAFDPFDVTLGLRYSWYEFSFDEFTSGPDGGPEQDGSFDDLTGSVAVARDLGPDWRVTGILSQGFRAPHLDDLAKNGSIFGGTELANPDLEPEQSLTAEVDLDYGSDPWAGSLAVFYTEIDDAIGRRLVDVGDPGQTGDETYLRDNVGEILVWGSEARVRRRLEGALEDFAVGGAVSWLRGRQCDDTVDPVTGEAPYDGVPARRIPPLVGSLSLFYEPLEPDRAITWGELRMTAADDQDELNPEDLTDPRIDPEGTPGWTVLDLDFGGPLGKRGQGSSWSVGLHNLTDKEYRVHGSGFDATGFNLVVGLSWSF